MFDPTASLSALRCPKENVVSQSYMKMVVWLKKSQSG